MMWSSELSSTKNGHLDAVSRDLRRADLLGSSTMVNDTAISNSSDGSMICPDRKSQGSYSEFERIPPPKSSGLFTPGRGRLLILIWVLTIIATSALAADKNFTPRIYMEIAEAPRAVFPKATMFERRDISVTNELSKKIKARVGKAKPTIWEPSYITFIARDAHGILGYTVICEEIGKHYPITFIVGVTPEGKVEDVAIMAYREPQGSEVRFKGFLNQFRNKSLKNPILPHIDITNISGATLSTLALARGVRKALSVIQIVYLENQSKEVSQVLPRNAATRAGRHELLPDISPSGPLLSGSSSRVSSQVTLFRRAHYIMGTMIEIAAYGVDPYPTLTAIEAAFEPMREVDRVMSSYRDDTDLVLLNRNAAGTFVPVREDLYRIIESSVAFSELSNGAFDITVGPLMRTWGFFQMQGHLPSPKEQSYLRAVVGYRHLQLDPVRRAVRFEIPGMEIDLGGIAKGWAVDQAAEVLRAYGIQRALINAGTSSIYAIGAPPDQEAWMIGIRDPLKEGQIFAAIGLRDLSLSTSGNYERYIRVHGKRYSHIVDPSTGFPVRDVLSTTVVAPTALESDALSTAVFVLGANSGARLLADRGLEGLMVYNEKGRVTTKVFSQGGLTPIYLASNKQ